MGRASSASSVRLRRAWRQPRVPQPQRAVMGSVGAFKPWPSPAPDDHRIRVGGAEAPRERPLPAPRTSVGSPRATNPPLFVRRRRRPREAGFCLGAHPSFLRRGAHSTGYYTALHIYERGGRGGPWPKERVFGRGGADGRVVAWEGERAERCRVRRGGAEEGLTRQHAAAVR